MTDFVRAFYLLFAGLFLLAVVSGCDGSEDEAPARLRVVHAATAGSIDFFIDFDLFTRSLSFREASPYTEWEPGLRLLEARAVADNQTTSISREVLLEADRSYTVLVADLESEASIVLLEDDRSTPPAGQARLRMAHGATRFGSINVFAVQAGSSSPVLEVSDLAFGNATPQVHAPAGAYDFLVETANGSGGGALREQPVEAGRRYLVVFTNSGIAPLFVVADG